MDAATALRQARRRAGFTQREVARRAGVPQPAIARIESGGAIPRIDTLERLLAACEHGLEVRPRLGIGVDRTVIRALLRLTPLERAQLAAQEGANLTKALRTRRPAAKE